MGIQEWTRRSALVLLAATAFATSSASTAGAGAPIGYEIASGLPARLLLDEHGSLVVYALGATTVRAIDLEQRTSRDFDVAATCSVPAGGEALTAVGDGYALLGCRVQAAGRPPWQPRVLDLTSGATIVPAGLDAAMAYPSPSFLGISRETLSFDSTDHRQSSKGFVLDWHTGAIAPDPNVPLVCPPGGARWANGVEGYFEAVGCDGRGRVELHRPLRAGERTSSGRARMGGPLLWLTTSGGRARQYAYLHRCRTRLAWDVPLQTTSWTYGGDILLGEGDGGPVTLRRIALDGVCERLERPWTLRLSGRGATVRVQPSSASVADPVTNAEGTLLSPYAARTVVLRARPRARVVIVRSAAASRLRWSAGRRWFDATGRGTRWTVRLPARARALRLEMRLDDGSRASYAVAVRRIRG